VELEVLDPLQDDIALDTYYHRRASLYFRRAGVAAGERNQYFAAVRRGDEASASGWIFRLHRGVERLEPILLLEPPRRRACCPSNGPPSRWHTSPNATREARPGQQGKVARNC
jgi:hypothetical protein